MPELDKYLEELFKHMYYLELERKESIYNNLSLPIGVTTLLIGVGAYYAQNFPSLKIEFWPLFFIILYALFILSLIFTGYFLGRVIWKYTYAYISTSKELNEDTLQLMKYYEYYPPSNDSSKIDSHVVDNLRIRLISQYVTCCYRNTQNNDAKIGYRARAHISLIIATFLLVCSFIPFCVLQASVPKVQKVEIVNLRQGGEKDVRGTIPQDTPTPGKAR